jgi:hypothetical protein
LVLMLHFKNIIPKKEAPSYSRYEKFGLGPELLLPKK